jgi:hypothetical protein
MQRQLASRRGVRRQAPGADVPTAYDRKGYASRDATRLRPQNIGSAAYDKTNHLRRSNRRGFGSARDQMMTTIRREHTR